MAGGASRLLHSHALHSSITRFSAVSDIPAKPAPPTLPYCNAVSTSAIITTTLIAITLPLPLLLHHHHHHHHHHHYLTHHI